MGDNVMILALSLGASALVLRRQSLRRAPAVQRRGREQRRRLGECRPEIGLKDTPLQNGRSQVVPVLTPSQ